MSSNKESSMIRDKVFYINDSTSYDAYIISGLYDKGYFDNEFLNFYNVRECYSFNISIVVHPDIKAMPVKIGPEKNATHANLSYFFEKYSNIFLKINAIDSEYKWLQSLDTLKLNKIKQMVIYYFNDVSQEQNILQKITETHNVVFNDHESITILRKDVILPVAIDDSPIEEPLSVINEDNATIDELLPEISDIIESTENPMLLVIEEEPVVVEKPKSKSKPKNNKKPKNETINS